MSRKRNSLQVVAYCLAEHEFNFHHPGQELKILECCLLPSNHQQHLPPSRLNHGKRRPHLLNQLHHLFFSFISFLMVFASVMYGGIVRSPVGILVFANLLNFSSADLLYDQVQGHKMNDKLRQDPITT